MKLGAADLYDYIYSWKDYKAEAAGAAAILVGEGIAEGARVCEAACGTARYLEHLQNRFEVSGYDLDPQMIRLAKWRAPRGTFSVGDMRRFVPPEPVDALLCLFGGVGYLSPGRALSEGLARFAEAVRPGGVVLIEPWVVPERFVAGEAWLQTYESPDFKLARVVVPRLEGRCCVLEFHFQLARAGGRVVRAEATERLWLHRLEEVREAAEVAGFSVVLTEQGFMADRHLFVCRRA
jgi:ubiquinone/menaquinone biosynthesis C-methylase UbiE